MKPIIRYTTDVALNDSDKTETIASAQTREIVAIGVKLTTTATVGNRQIAVEILDSDSNVVYAAYAGATQAASLTRAYHFAQGVVGETSFSAGNSILAELPSGLVLPPGFQVRVFDESATDAAADDMEVYTVAKEFPI